jgi:hypothetical protein
MGYFDGNCLGRARRKSGRWDLGPSGETVQGPKFELPVLNRKIRKVSLMDVNLRGIYSMSDIRKLGSRGSR